MSERKPMYAYIEFSLHIESERGKRLVHEAMIIMAAAVINEGCELVDLRLLDKWADCTVEYPMPDFEVLSLDDYGMEKALLEDQPWLKELQFELASWEAAQVDITIMNNPHGRGDDE